MAGIPTVVAEPEAGYELTVIDLDPLRASIRAVGEFDLAARHDLVQIFQDQEDAGRRFIGLDLSEVTFLDCSCLDVLVAWHERLLERHGLLVLVGVGGRVSRVLTVTGLDDSLFIVPADQDPFGNVLLARAGVQPTSSHRQAVS